MNLPTYITVEEVQKVCRELGLRDWTKISEPRVTQEEADLILTIVNTQNMEIDPDDFRQGLEVELEHGTIYADANVTNNHPVITGKIVLAHLKETLDYYRRIDVAEIEGDLLQAIVARDIERIEEKYTKLALARQKLDETVSKQLKHH